MKILTHLNFTLFLSSFVLIILSSYQTLNIKTNYSSFEAQFSQSTQGFNSSGQPMSENNEFEDDNDNFEIACFIFQFLVSFEQCEITSSHSPRLQYKIETFQEAIYLTIHSFRI